MRKERSIAVLGSMNIDLVFRVPRLPQNGETLQASGFASFAGGKGANQAVAAARYGAQVALFGAVGSDAYGEQLLSGLALDAISTKGVVALSGVATGMASIAVDDHGSNQILVVGGANMAFNLAHLKAAKTHMSKAALVLCQLETAPEVVLTALQNARAAGQQTVLNPSPLTLVEPQLFALAHTLVLNEHEAGLLLGQSVQTPEQAKQALLQLAKRYGNEVVITLGEQGVALGNVNRVSVQAAFKTQVVDTTAAGDTFTGVLAAALCQGMALEQAAHQGQRAAAVCVSRAGAQASIPYLSELSAS